MYRILVGNDAGKVYLAIMTLIWPHMMVPHAMAATAAATVTYILPLNNFSGCEPHFPFKA